MRKVLLALVILGQDSVSAFCPRTSFVSPLAYQQVVSSSNYQNDHLLPTTTTQLSAFDSADEQAGVDAWTRFASEDTLMSLRIRVVDSTCDVKDMMAEVFKYTKKFPFSAVLPVQPLQYTPTEDGGVEVTFLRKKTKEKGSIDGGMRFFIRQDEEEDDEDMDSSSYPIIEIVVKRNSEGQSISKIFSEKQVVLAYLDGILSNNKEKTYGDPSGFLEKISVESLFHKWMELPQ